ncbi:MAG TPA: hypothetical protein ENI92_07810, partial [Bacteroidetes bacterium]|nr:hypothetical protein [Bacteroidota bacterium]
MKRRRGWRVKLYRPVGWATVLLFLAGGCGRPARIPGTDPGLLSRMAEVRRGPQHALLLSGSGLTACLPVADRGEAPPPLPVEGLYLDGFKLLAGWSWSGLEGAAADSGSPARIRPDAILRPVAAGLMERLTLDPERPAAVLELTGRSKGEVEWAPWMDLRPITVPVAATVTRYDARERILFIFGPDSLTLALAARGDWVSVPARRSVEYAVDDPPLEEVATVEEPGRFLFPPGGEARIGIGVARRAAVAAELARGAEKNPGALRKRATARVLAELNRAPFSCADPDLEAVAAWDRWLLLRHYLPGLHGGFVRRPPLDTERDPGADGIALPAAFWAAAGDTLFDGLLAGRLDPAVAASDPEGTALALAGWAEWVDLTGRTAHLANEAKDLAVVLENLPIDGGRLQPPMVT